jgi:hypothetical protein
MQVLTQWHAQCVFQTHRELRICWYHIYMQKILIMLKKTTFITINKNNKKKQTQKSLTTIKVAIKTS